MNAGILLVPHIIYRCQLSPDKPFVTAWAIQKQANTVGDFLPKNAGSSGQKADHQHKRREGKANEIHVKGVGKNWR